MKVYFLKFDSADLTLENGLWVSSVVDLYGNPDDVSWTHQYTNYSSKKSSYGLGGALYTWAGLKKSSAVGLTDFEYFTAADLESQDEWTDFDTDTGYIRAGRYIDASGSIDLVNFVVDSGDPLTKLTVYSDGDSDETNYETEWAKTDEKLSSELLEGDDVNRFAKFVFSFDANQGPFSALVRVEISEPVIAPLHRFTRVLMDKFPQWMKMHELPQELATPEVMEPNSIGSKLVNSMVGGDLDEARRLLDYYRFQLNIVTVDLSQMAEMFVTDGIPERIYEVSVGGVQPTVCSSFYELTLSKDPYAVYIDYNESAVYGYSEQTLVINGETYPQEATKVFNFIDDLGAKVDLPRLSGEGNDAYRKRILDVHKNPPGPGIEGLKLTLRRELDLWRTEGATPDSDYEGATPEILEMEDLLLDAAYFTEEGIPKPLFTSLVEDLSNRYPMTWGRFVWGQAYWDSAGEDLSGFGTIPNKYDVDSFPDRKAGVGSGSDLYLHRPDAFTGPRDYNATLRAKGRARSFVNQYTKVDLDFTVQPTATRDIYDNPLTTVYFTIEVTTNEAGSPVYYHSFTLSSRSDVDADTPTLTSASYSYYNFFSQGANATLEDIDFRLKTSNLPYGEDFATPLDNPGVIPTGIITKVELIQGRWLGGSYQNIEVNDYFEAWFDTDPGTKLDFADLVDIIENGAPIDRPTVVMSSKQVATPAATLWYGDEIQHGEFLNGVAPFSEGYSKTIKLPEIFFPSDAYSKSILVTLKTQDPNGAGSELGATTRNDDSETVFIPSEYVLIDGVGSWDGNGVATLAEGSLEFSLAVDENAPMYPIQAEIWNYYEAAQIVPFSGIVDENGPWLNGASQTEGSLNFTANLYDSLDRSDFGIPDTDDYIITRMDIENDNSRVVAYLDTNRVIPANPDDLVASAEGAGIQEVYNGATSTYYFSPFNLYARANLGPTPDWKPQVNSGYLYTKEEDYYLYAKPAELSTTLATVTLPEDAHQGAPIIVFDGDTEMRQVLFFDDETLERTLTNTEVLTPYPDAGNFYLSYSDIYGVEIKDANGNVVNEDISSATNKIKALGAYTPLDSDMQYTATYTVANSFYAEYGYLDADNKLKTRLFFDSVPDSSYEVTYEASDFDPATPVGVALNPIYSALDEGFVFISDNEYDLRAIVGYMSPSKLIADGEDYSFLTFEALDSEGNPKPNQVITLTTNFGTLESASITTDDNGFAFTTLTSESGSIAVSGTITVDGPGIVDGTMEFEIAQPGERMPRIVAVPQSYQLQADGNAENSIVGRLTKGDLTTPPKNTVSWKKARTRFDLFNGNEDDGGSVTSDANGNFVITGLVSETTPGIWFVSVEALIEGELVGDVVYWVEYEEVSRGTENINGQPGSQDFASSGYAAVDREIVAYQEDTAPTVRDTNINWLPPVWYGIRAEDQYQIGSNINTTERVGDRQSRGKSLIRNATGAWSARYRDPLTGGLLDLSGNGREAVFGEKQAQVYEDYLYLPGTTGNYAYTPYEAAFSPTNSIDLRWKGTLSSAIAVMISKRGVGGTGAVRHFSFEQSTGGAIKLFLYDAAGSAIATQNANPSLSYGWVRATYDNGTGEVKLYESTDDTDEHTDVSWTLLHSYTTSTGGLRAGSTDIEYGSMIDGTSTLYEGKIHAAAMLADGVEVLNTQFADIPRGQTSGINKTGQSVIIGQSRGVTNDPQHLPYDGTRYLYLSGVDGNYAHSPNTNHISAKGAHPTAARLGSYLGYWSTPVTFDTNVTPFLAGTGGALHVDLDQGTAGKSAYGVAVQPQMSSTMHSDGASVTVGAIVKAPAGLTVRISHRFSDANNILLGDGLASGTDFVTTGEWQLISATRTYTGAAFKALPQVTVANTEDLTTDLWVGGFMTAAGTYTGVFPPSLRFTDDVDLRAKFTLPSTIATRGSVVGTHTTDGKHGAEFQIQTSGGIQFLYGDGTGQTVNATTALLAAGETHTVRVTRDAGTGDITYYTSSDDGVTWDFFDADTSPAGSMGTLLPLGTFAGGRGGTAFPLEGGLYWVALHDGIDGPKVWDVDFTSATQFPDGGAAITGTAATGQVVTVARSTSGRKAVLVDRPALLLGTDDYLTAGVLGDFEIGSGPFTAVAVFRQFATPGNMPLVDTKNYTGIDSGWTMGPRSDGNTLMGIADDTTLRNVQITASVVEGAIQTMALVTDPSVPTVMGYIDGQYSGNQNGAVVTPIANTTALTIGHRGDFVGSAISLELYGVAVFVGQILTAAEIEQVGKELST